MQHSSTNLSGVQVWGGHTKILRTLFMDTIFGNCQIMLANENRILHSSSCKEKQRKLGKTD